MRCVWNRSTGLHTRDVYKRQVESALQAFGYLVLQDHLETCVVEEIRKGNTLGVDEALELIKKLK